MRLQITRLSSGDLESVRRKPHLVNHRRLIYFTCQVKSEIFDEIFLDAQRLFNQNELSDGGVQWIFLLVIKHRLEELGLERLVTQKLLDVVKRVAKEELQSENWLRLVARLSARSYEEMRVAILEFLDTDVFHVPIENCVSFLDPLIELWDIDLATFGLEIVLNRRVAPGHPKKFEFVEKEPEPAFDEEPGLKEFLHDASLRGDATEEEIEFLKGLRFKERRPAPLYYYRELQNLRDPLHFRTPGEPKELH